VIVLKHRHALGAELVVSNEWVFANARSGGAVIALRSSFSIPGSTGTSCLGRQRSDERPNRRGFGGAHAASAIRDRGGPGLTPERELSDITGNELPTELILDTAQAPQIAGDRPVNEYFALRQRRTPSPDSGLRRILKRRRMLEATYPR